VKIGLALPVFSDDASKPLAFAARAAALGYDGLFAADHLFPPMGPASPSLEAFTTLSAVAARHPHMTVGTLVTRVTLRPAGMLAAQAAALDRMSGGNALIALGTGDRISIPEHETFGFPFPPITQRRARLEETILALRELFAGRPWTGGEHVPAIRGPLLPPPMRPGGPPLWVGGVADAAVDLAARVADGWNGWGLDADGFAAKAERLRAAGDREVEATWGGIAVVGEDDDDLTRLLADRADRGLSAGDAWTGTVEDLRAFARRLAAAGAGWAVFLPGGPPDRLELIARTLIP
jgi:alkanesulfonate monooxygenase SsuD/methylene tetrahydromethanopterin reductase-like flavin-dependent oxidoreductase (luciferase family)